MTIYDMKLYGVHLPVLSKGTRVILSQNMDEVYSKAPIQYRFEVMLLEQYGAMRDVLLLKFLDGHREYITLYEPAMYLDDGEWIPTKETNLAEEFLAEYERAKEISQNLNNTGIFDLTFYGIQEDSYFKQKRVYVYLSEASRDMKIVLNSMLFTATILKEYKGNKYVIKLVAESGEVCYIPLFNANMYYDNQKQKWDYCNESPIPKEILKCYVKHLNG